MKECQSCRNPVSNGATCARSDCPHRPKKLPGADLPPIDLVDHRKPPVLRGAAMTPAQQWDFLDAELEK